MTGAAPWMMVLPRDGHVARFESIGWKLPTRHATTADLMASTLHPTSIDLERLTGIHEHRICSKGEDSLTLAVDAARDCLARSRHPASDLEVVIDASITRHDAESIYRFEPPLSLSVKEAIGAHGAFSFDISNACAGMLTGVYLLSNLIRRGDIRCGMVVSGEHITGLGTNAARSIRNILSPQLASLTLGDAGAAVIVERAADGTPGIELAGFTTLAEHSRLCVGFPAADQPGAKMYTRARAIHQVAMTDGPVLLDQILDKLGIALDEVDWFIPHQTSVRALRAGVEAVARRVGGRPKNLVVTVDEYGNTASTTLFLALHRCLDEGRLQVGDRVLLLSVASGLEVGVVVFVVDELKERHGHVH